MSRRAEFEAEHPEVHVLSADQAGRVDLVMGAVGWLGDEEQVTTCASLGGESSTVMRVELQELRGGWRTAVLKQSLPWLRRDESVAMPADRWHGERAFYAEVARVPEAAAHLPRLMAANEARSLLLLEDFRGASNLASLYRGGVLGVEQATALGSFLAALRRVSRAGAGTTGPPSETRADQGAGVGDRETKALIHRMVFEAPFAAPDADGEGLGPDGPALDTAALEALAPGLGRAASALRADRALGEAVAELGRRFLGGTGSELGPHGEASLPAPEALADRPAAAPDAAADDAAAERRSLGLVHGGFHPANWLLLPNGDVRIVGPEYGGWGPPEFDVGTGLAHLLLAEQPEEVVAAFLSPAIGSEDAEEGEPGVDRPLVARYAGVEIVRRLIGGGQLPLEAESESRCGLLETARTAVVSGRLGVLET